MKKRKFLILMMSLLLISCGENGPKYYQNYESCTLNFYEPTDEMWTYNKKHLVLENNLYNECKSFILEYINYGDKKNLVEIGDGGGLSYLYCFTFVFEDKYDSYRFDKYNEYVEGYIQGREYYSEERHPKIDNKLVNKRNSIIEKIDKELKKIEFKKVIVRC